MLLKVIAGIAIFQAPVIYCCIVVGKRAENDWKQLQDAADSQSNRDGATHTGIEVLGEGEQCL